MALLHDVTTSENELAAEAARPVSPARAFCDEYIERFATVNPVHASFWGMEGFDDLWNDLSPAGWSRYRDLISSTLGAAAAVPIHDDGDRVAIDVLRERISTDLEAIDLGAAQLGLSTFDGHHIYIREIFDFMSREGDQAWRSVRRRLETIPDVFDAYRATALELAARGVVGLRSQTLACAGQCLSWAEPGGPFDIVGAGNPEVAGDAARIAMQAFHEHGTWLRDVYAPLASGAVGIGRDGYRLAVRQACGLEPDLDELYAWGWHEVRRISAEMDRLVAELAPGATRGECMERLSTDPRLCVADADAFVRWSQETIESAFDSLDGRIFDIPAALRTCETRRIPSDMAGDSYYTPPSEDFSRPGMVWHPIDGRDRFPLWLSLSTLYHEAVPGHHLQLGHMMYLADRLTRFQRLGVYIPAHGEGWALYAERLMRELGYLDDPAYELGWLVNQSLRAARVVVDIGMHCAMRIPDDESFHPGEVWTAELGAEFIRLHTAYDEAMSHTEIERYLGMPAQAISYKVGERVWLAGREQVRARQGAAFDLRAFHTRALDLGAMGLDMLTRELASF